MFPCFYPVKYKVQNPYPIWDENGQIPYSIMTKTATKPISFGAAHTHVAYTREVPPFPTGKVVIRECFNKDLVWPQEVEWDHSTTEDKSRVVTGLRICNKYICIDAAL